MLDEGYLFDWSVDGSVDISTVVLSEWDGGATVSVILTNTGSEAVSDWGLRWDNTGSIDYFWDASVETTDGMVIAVPHANRNDIAAGEAVAFGFNVSTGPEGWVEPVFDFGMVLDDSEPPVPQPEPQPGPEPSTTDDLVPTDLLTISVDPFSTWNTGFSVNIAIANPTNTDIDIGEVRWLLPEGVTIDFVWNAGISVEDGVATAKPNEGFVTVKAGEAISFGFNASHASGVATEFTPVVYLETADGTESTEPPVDLPPPSDTEPPQTWNGEAPLNPIFGTQSIGPGYTFTGDGSLVETAQAIADTGSNIIKIALDPTLYGMSGLYQWQPVDLLTKNEQFAEVLAMDFDHYFFWLERSGPWADNQGISAEEYDAEYKVTYDLATYLLTTFEGTGKTFYIGNWETDWNLLEWNPTVQDVDEVRVQGLIDWLNLRQDAIDQAKADVNAEGVWIYHYVEVNRVDDADELGFERTVNAVLPNTHVDLVSYSAYDVILDEANIGHYAEVLGENLDFIAAQLAPKDGLPFENRVFLGEFGFYLTYVTPEQQYDLTISVLQAAVEWGVPFALVWQMYDTAANEGLYLIGPDGEPTAVHAALTDYNAALDDWYEAFRMANGRVPTEAEVRDQSLSILDNLSNATAAGVAA